MDTCLYTGAQLDEATKVEHTIPESLGGRVKSQIVTSSTFNELCGAYLVPALKKPYGVILNRLGPLLPSAHKSGKLRVDILGETPGFALDENGILTQTKLDIVARDEKTKRPRAVTGTDERAIRNVLRQAGARDDQIVLSFVPATSENVFNITGPVIWTEIEISALNCILITFDHLMRDSEERFTRQAEFEEVRNFIRDAVQKRKIDDGELLNRISLGLQYEKMPLLENLRNKVPHPKSSFEHVLYASANSPTQTLDLVWSIFGFDPYGFRIPWKGCSFTYVFVNPILSNTECSNLVSIPTSYMLCTPTNRRAFPNNTTTLEEMDYATTEIISKRNAAIEEAVYLVEMEADDFIVSNLKVAGDLSQGDTPLMELVSKRIRSMYGRKADESVFLEYVENIIKQNVDGIESSAKEQVYVAGEGNENVDWKEWLQFYRQCLAVVVGDHGKPGDVFKISSGIIQDRVDSRLLGEEPDH